MGKHVKLKEYTKYTEADNKEHGIDIFEICSAVQEELNSKETGNVVTINGEDLKDPSIFTIDKKNRTVKLHGYVGIIKANIEIDDENNEDLEKKTRKDVTITIGSRFDSGKDQFFLNYIFSKIMNFKGKIFEDMDPDVSPETNWDILFVIIFIKYFEEANKTGFYRKYRTFEYNDSKLKGKIDITRHINLNPLQNGKIAYSTREFTVDNSINHLILLASDLLEKKHNKVYKNIIKEKPDLRRAINELKVKIPNYRSIDPRSVLKDTSKTITHPYYHRYEGLRKISIMILRRLGYNIFQESGSAVAGVVIDMASLWEDFLKTAIFNDLELENYYEIKTQDERGILKSNDSSESNFKRKIKPDFTVCKKNGENIEYKAVFDAKYRETWGMNVFKNGDKDESWDSGVREDVFQVMAYMLALNCDIGGVIFPVNIESKDIKKNELQKYSISEYCIDRSIYTMPYCIPKYYEEPKTSYDKFIAEMDEQNGSVRKRLVMLLNKKINKEVLIMIGFLLEKEVVGSEGGFFSKKDVLQMLVCDCPACGSRIQIATKDVNYKEFRQLYYFYKEPLECSKCKYSADFIIKDSNDLNPKVKFKRACNNCDSKYIFRYGNIEDDVRSGNKCDNCGDDSVTILLDENSL